MTASSALDPRAPLVLDTRELGGRRGTMPAVHGTIEAPGDWSLELVRVPAGSPVELDLRLEAVMEGVLVTGAVVVTVAAEWGGCLHPVTDQLDVDIQELYAYEPADRDDEQPLLTGDFIDIEPLVRDAVLLGLPLNPVCNDDCEGLCADCGARLSEVGPDHAHDDLDPRWAALTQLTPDSSTES